MSNTDSIALFGEEVRMSHTTDPDTSKLAAHRVRTGLKRDTIQDAIVSILKDRPGTAREILVVYTYSRGRAGWPHADLYDIRRRLTEVSQAGRVVDTGVRRNGERVMGPVAS